MNTKDSLSQLEKNFITQSTFRRNTRYYDAPQVSNLQTQYQIRRRKPISLVNDTTKDKIDSSFTHSTTVLNEKLSKDIDKFKNRIGSDDEEDPEEQSPSRSPSLSPKVRSFSIGKMVSRKYVDHQTDKHQTSDERLFNNFKIQKHDLSQTNDFGKLKDRKNSIHLQHINDLYHDQHQRIYQQYYYKRSTTNCKFNYKLENKKKQRYFFIKRRPQNQPSTKLEPEKVDKGLKIASNFKGSNLKNDGIDAFYKGSGRDLPSHFDSRFMNELTNDYKGNDGKITVPQLDYIVAKLKDDMETQRKKKLQQSKRPTFGRNEICDERYFKMNGS